MNSAASELSLQAMKNCIFNDRLKQHFQDALLQQLLVRINLDFKSSSKAKINNFGILTDMSYFLSNSYHIISFDCIPEHIGQGGRNIRNRLNVIIQSNGSDALQRIIKKMRINLIAKRRNFHLLFGKLDFIHSQLCSLHLLT
ncbi:hypothetical protein D3C78_1392990 [compost metagenome]